MPDYKLTYFALRGRGQPIRYLLHDNDVPYAEDLVAFKDWPARKTTFHFGQIPCLTVDGFELVQSNAIMRYLGRELGLYGNGNKEAAMIDMISDSIEDIKGKYVRMIYQDYENGKENHIKKASADFEKLEKLLEANSGGRGFLVGNKITFVDYLMYELLEAYEILDSSILAKCPLLQAYHQRIGARPKIAAFKNSEPFNSFPLNGNGKQ